MDPTDSVINPRLSVSETETEATRPVRSPEIPVSPGSPTPIESEPVDAVSEPHLPAPTPPPTAPHTEVLEHAYWAEFEEDTTTPEEDELKEIDGADADYSASDRRSILLATPRLSEVTDAVTRPLLGKQFLSGLGRSRICTYRKGSPDLEVERRPGHSRDAQSGQNYSLPGCFHWRVLVAHQVLSSRKQCWLAEPLPRMLSHDA